MFYWIFRRTMSILFHIFYRLRITGTHHFPSEGSFIVCANHIHTFDPVIICFSTKRKLHFIAKKELWDNPFKRPFLKPLNIFPVNRGTADMNAIRQAIEILNGGNGLVVFSQGSRMKELTDFKSGAALFALKTGASIVPVGISGSYRLFSEVRIQVGEPIAMKPYEGRKIKSELVDEVMEVVVDHVKRLTQ